MSETSPDALALQRYVSRVEPRGLLVGHAVLVLAALYPFLMREPSTLLQFLLIAIYSIVVLGLNITLGYAGEFAIGQSGLFFIGAYVSGMLTSFYGWSFWAALPVAMLSAGVAGILIGAPGLRVGGWYFALTTLVFAVAIPQLAYIVPNAGGDEGLSVPYPSVFGHTLTLSELYAVTLCGLLAVVILSRNLVKSGWGLAFLIMRENSSAAEAIGISVRHVKLLVLRDRRGVCWFGRLPFRDG